MVYRAHDSRLDRNVAVKILNGVHVSDATARARLRREAQIAGSLHHPGIATVFDYDEDQSTPALNPFIVMQHIDGIPLSRLLVARGRIPSSEVPSILVQVADALKAAHAIGVVHRDLKPANIIITERQTAVLVDFGIAQLPGGDPLTATGSILGTVEYLSPEQASGRTATTQSDLYALGVVAYVCLTGSSPFKRDTALATAWAHVNDPAPPLGDDVPPGLRNLVEDMMAKDPQARPTTAAEVSARASALGDVKPIQLPVTQELSRIDSEPLREVPPSTRDLSSTVTQPPVRRRMRAFLGLAVGAVLVGLLGIWGLVQSKDEGSTVPDVVTLPISEATAKIRASGLNPVWVYADNPSAERGRVLTQSPDPKVDADRDAVVKLTVSSGRMPVAAASYVGMPVAAAQAALEKLGFVVARRNVASVATSGTVLALDRSGRLVVGSTITLSIASPMPVTSSSSTGTSSSGPTSSKAKSSNSKGSGKGKK